MFIANSTDTQYSFLETTTLTREQPKAAQNYNILRSAIIN
jgi:hypothetical protein